MKDKQVPPPLPHPPPLTALPRSISERGLALLRQYEGFSALPYVDAAYHETIGYGHRIRAGECFPIEGLTREDAEALLKYDAGAAAAALRRMVELPLSQHRFDALTCFIFNVGAGAFARSALRKKVRQEQHGDVPAELMRWVYVKGKRLKGLENRRSAEAELYQTIEV